MCSASVQVWCKVGMLLPASRFISILVLPAFFYPAPSNTGFHFQRCLGKTFFEFVSSLAWYGGLKKQTRLCLFESTKHFLGQPEKNRLTKTDISLASWVWVLRAFPLEPAQGQPTNWSLPSFTAFARGRHLLHLIMLLPGIQTLDYVAIFAGYDSEIGSVLGLKWENEIDHHAHAGRRRRRREEIHNMPVAFILIV